MPTQSYILGYTTTDEGQSQNFIPCVANSILQSSASDIPPTFVLNSTLQSDWNETDNTSIAYIKNKPTITTRSQSSASRSLNSVFQPNSTRDTLVNYSVDIACTLTLTTGQSGTVFLEIASNSGFTSNVQELARFVNGNTGTLAIGLSLTQNVTGTLSGYVPAGYYVRLRTANNTGTPTFTYRSGQEVLL